MPFYGIRIGSTRAHLDTRTLKTIIESTVGVSARNLSKNFALRKKIGDVYLKAVEPYIPKDSGNLIESGVATKDGRLLWTGGKKVAPDYYNANAYADYVPYIGQDYAVLQYNVPMQHYESSGVVSHKRRARWTSAVRPGTDAWSLFIDDITPIIMEEFGDGLNDK